MRNSLLALSQGLQHIRNLRRAGIAIQGDVLEFGAGWVPVVPLILHLAGAQRVILTECRTADGRTYNRDRHPAGA